MFKSITFDDRLYPMKSMFVWDEDGCHDNGLGVFLFVERFLEC